MVGADQSYMNLSLPGSVIAITLLHSMTPNASLCWLDVRILMSLDSIGAQLADCQGDRLVLLL